MNKFMKRTSIIRKISIILAIMFMLSLAGCAKEQISQSPEEIAIHGQWTYAHDEKEVVASFFADGSAKFEGVKYTYSCADGYIHLTDKDGKVTKLRYVAEGDQMYVYIQSTYTRQPEGGGSGVVGVWLCEGKGWTFEFTNKGTFMEDGALTGYYEVEEDLKAVKLMYGEALEDTLFYYELDGDKLHVEYPWLMIKR